MITPGNWRHELKYQISAADEAAICQRLFPVMKPDPHTGPDGRYQIRSIYFDNADDKALLEKINGLQKREKFRIRYYNDDFSFITLEKKIKHNQLCLKVDARITYEECRALLLQDTDWMVHHPNELVRELYCKMKFQQLRPRVLVSYVRKPFIYPAGNVRVTFDSCIRTSLFHPLDPRGEVPDIEATQEPGQRILEVKYDAFLPEHLSWLLQLDGMRQSAFSKYGVCRRFG